MFKFIPFLLCLFPFSAYANTMTFNDYYLSYGSIGSSYEEDGITAQSNNGSGYSSDSGYSVFYDSDFYALEGNQNIQLWPYGSTSSAGFVAFTMEKNFNAVSVDLANTFDDFHCRGLDTEHCAPDGPFYTPFDPMFIKGFNEGNLVADVSFAQNTAINYVFGPEFSNLDRLVIGLRGHPYDACGDECLSGTIDNVSLSAVPIPAALPLFGAGLLALGLFRKFKKSS